MGFTINSSSIKRMTDVPTSRGNSLRVNSKCSYGKPIGPMPRLRQRNTGGHISSGSPVHAGMHRHHGNNAVTWAKLHLSISPVEAWTLCGWSMTDLPLARTQGLVLEMLVTRFFLHCSDKERHMTRC